MECFLRSCLEEIFDGGMRGNVEKNRYNKWHRYTIRIKLKYKLE